MTVDSTEVACGYLFYYYAAAVMDLVDAVTDVDAAETTVSSG